jgi:hypothetical protein
MPVYGIRSWFMTLGTDNECIPNERRGNSGFRERVPKQEPCTEIIDGIL